MEVKHSPDVPAGLMDGVTGMTVRLLWPATDDEASYTLQLVEIAPGAVTPPLQYIYRHEIYVLSGEGSLQGKSQEYTLVPDDTIFIPPHEEHQFSNTYTELFRFLSVIPHPGTPLEITAQVSLYPLRQPALAPEIEEALEILRHHGLKVTPGPMSSLVAGESTDIFYALQRAFGSAAKRGEVVMVTTFSNACPAVDTLESKAPSFKPIGFVRNEFAEPTEPNTLKSSSSQIVIEPGLIDGLTGLSPGSKMLVIFYFHKSEGYELLQHPRGDRTRPQRGVFALHSPHRPNPIGVTEVELLKVQDNVLTVRGLDAIDGTPVLDLKSA
jgi:tRNA-Thr(GGU) m(6)t(6)A37 methyltransferase TsaA